MTDTEVPEPIASIQHRDYLTDVTETFEDEIEMLIEVQDLKTLSVPIDYVVAYRVDDPAEDHVHDDGVYFRFTASVNRDLFGDEVFGVQMHIAEEHIEDGSITDTDVMMENFNRVMRALKEHIWARAVSNDGQ